MANKAISELPQALNVNNQDLFVLEQSGIAKKLTAETFITEQGIIDALAEALDGHGGISSVTLQSLSGRIRTYLITFTDGSATTFQVLDGTSISRIEKTSTAGLVDTYTVFMTDGTTSFFQVRNGQDGSATWDQINSKAPIITDTVTGAIVNFPDGADDIPVADLVVNIEPVQSGSGDPSPSNIRPITGWTGANVTRTGKNLFDKDNVIALSNVNVTVNGTTITAITTANNTYRDIHFDIPAKPLIGKTVTLSGQQTTSTNSSNSAILRKVMPDNTYSNIQSSTSASFSFSATVPDCEYLRIYFPINSSTGAVGISRTFTNVQLEVGSSATAYEEYVEPTTLAIDWTTEAGTVYGGTIDVATGVLTVDKLKYVCDGSDSVGWTSFATYGSVSRFDMTSLDVVINSGGNLVCNMFPRGTIGTIDLECVNVHSSQKRIQLQIDTSRLNGTTVADLMTFFASYNLELVYELATPQTYQLTPQEVKTLLGTNNVWTDIGNVSVTYPADTKLYIEKLTMPTEDDLVANQAITSGKYFMIGNSLFLALANIANGAQITIGTNAQRVSLADALNTINS